MTVARDSHLAVLLPDGKVLIVPGTDGDDSETAEIYDPFTGTFSATDFEKFEPDCGHRESARQW